MERGDGRQNDVVVAQNDVGVGVDELLFALLQREDFEAIHPMIRWLQIGLLRGLLTEENLRVLGQVINQLPQHDIDGDNLQNDEEETDEEDEEVFDVPVEGIERNPPQEIEGPWDNNGAGDFELNPAEQAEDLIIEEMRW